MERRRPRLDPMLAEQVNQRLAFVLSDRPPRRAQLPAEAEEPAHAPGGPTSTRSARVRPAAPTPNESGSVGPAEFREPTELGPTEPGPTELGPTEPGPSEPGTDDLGGLHDLPPAPRFGRRHVGVLAVLLVLGLLGGGWSLLRTRPVAVASPGALVVATPAVSPAPPTAGTAASPAPELTVHVLGAVRRPGLVTLPDRSRVQDAIKAAGGLDKDADPGELNLAQPLADGQQVVIGRRGKPAGEVRDGGGGSGSAADPGGSTSTVDLNRANAAQLEELPGVGPVTAGKIVAWRLEHTRFSRVEELQEVDGIGPKTFAQLAPHVRV